MSEFQYIGFRAIDAPLTDKQLRYMESQSSRAEITRWSFDNIYHYGDFRGNAEEMLRRGYDIHLHYANFGIRTLMIRLPQGFSGPKRQWSHYFDGETVLWRKDAKGPAGVLTISAATEPGAMDELWDVDNYLERLVGVRQQLIDGDLGALYCAWLCGCQDDAIDPDTATEPPVPAGLGKPSNAVSALLEFFGLSSFVLQAAAERSPKRSQPDDPNAPLAEWLTSVDPKLLRQWLLRFLTAEPAAPKAECLQAFRKSYQASAWPVVEGTRTFAQLLARAEQLADAAQVREEKRQQRARQKRLADMAKAPDKYLDEVDRQVARRGRDSYEQAAQLLNDLREAVGGEKGDQIARKHAAALKKKYPTLNLLSGALRRHGLLS